MDLVFAPSQVESWPIARLRPYARNAKMHGDDQVAKIAASMAKFGWTVPCMVADDGELIAGHGRVLAATMLGLTEVPVIRLSHLDEAERRAYRIADNKLTELGEWDEALLRDEIAGLLAEDFDLTLLGISDDDLDALLRDPEALGGDGPVEGEDNVPELPVTPVSVPGDLWQLGAHRLICGDSTKADVVGRLLGDVRPLLMVTDPPYGVEYDPSWRNAGGGGQDQADRQGAERRPCRLARGLGAVPRRRRLCLARRAACSDRGREPGRGGLRHPVADHLGQGPAGSQPRRLSLAARTLLVCGARKGQGPLGRGPQADHAVADRQPGSGRRHGARHAEAGRMHAPPDPEQFQPRPSGL